MGSTEAVDAARAKATEAAPETARAAVAGEAEVARAVRAVEVEVAAKAVVDQAKAGVVVGTEMLVARRAAEAVEVARAASLAGAAVAAAWEATRVVMWAVTLAANPAVEAEWAAGMVDVPVEAVMEQALMVVVAAVAARVVEGTSDSEEEARREASRAEARAVAAPVAAARAVSPAGEATAACKAEVLARGLVDAMAGFPASAVAKRVEAAATVVPMEAAASAEVVAAYSMVELRVSLAAAPMSREVDSVAQAVGRAQRAARAGV